MNGKHDFPCQGNMCLKMAKTQVKTIIEQCRYVSFPSLAIILTCQELSL